MVVDPLGILDVDVGDGPWFEHLATDPHEPDQRAQAADTQHDHQANDNPDPPVKAMLSLKILVVIHLNFLSRHVHDEGTFETARV